MAQEAIQFRTALIGKRIQTLDNIVSYAGIIGGPAGVGNTCG